jgi:hypothetical protein
MSTAKLQVVSTTTSIRPEKGQRFPVKIRPVGENAWLVTLPDGQTRRIERRPERPTWEQYGFAWNGACAKGFETLERAVRACAQDCRLVFAPLAMTDKSARQLAEDCDRDLDLFTKTLRKLLRARTGRDWSVTRGKGTAYSWCRINAPKARTVEHGYLSVEDQVVLGSVLGQWVGTQGESIRTEAGVRGWYILKAIGASTDGWHVAEPGWD